MPQKPISSPSKPDSDQGAARPDAALLEAAYYGRTEEAINALKRGANVDATWKETGLTALHFAVGTHNYRLTKQLIEDWHATIQPDSWGRWPSLIALDTMTKASGALVTAYIVDQEAALQHDGDHDEPA